MEAQRQRRDVYLLGAANVGKSALVRSLLQLLAAGGQLAEEAAGGRRPQLLPTESAMPGTTLDVMPVAALASGGLVFGEPWSWLRAGALPRRLAARRCVERQCCRARGGGHGRQGRDCQQG
jgi:hypothetical protein